MNIVYHLIAVLNLARTIGALLTQAKAIVAAVGNNPTMFPVPMPTLAALNAAIQALDTKQTAAHARTTGAAASRNVALQTLKKALNLLKAYVQWTSDNAADLVQARAIIEAAGLTVKVVKARAKAELAAILGDHSGAIDLTAQAGPKGKKVFFDWQMSLDGKIWSSLTSTVYASTTVEDLTPATLVSFRYRRNDAKGVHDWSQVVSILVH